MTKDLNYVKVPKNYEETEVLDFGHIAKTIDTDTLMFMLRPDPGETFTPKTVFIPLFSKQPHWLLYEMSKTPDDFARQVAHLISHEVLHIVAHNIDGRQACDGIDELGFGTYCDCSNKRVDGLSNFDLIFKPRKNKLKGWK